jgi:hypothetical protein
MFSWCKHTTGVVRSFSLIPRITIGQPSVAESGIKTGNEVALK